MLRHMPGNQHIHKFLHLQIGRAALLRVHSQNFHQAQGAPDALITVVVLCLRGWQVFANLECW